MISRSLRPLVFATFAAVAPTLPAQTEPTPTAATAEAASPIRSVASLVVRPTEPMPELTLPSTPLIMVVAPIEDLTARTVLRQQGLPNPEINLVFHSVPTRAEAMQALESVLNLNQIALIPLGDKFIKMVPMQSVRMESPDLIEGSTLLIPASGRVASKLYSLDFLRVNEFVPQIAPLLNANIGNYALFEKANAVLITDSITNLQRIENLVTKLDRPALGALQTRFYSLQYAKASDLVNRLRTVLQGGLQTQLSTATSYTPDDRTNQVVLVSDPRQFPFFDDLIQKLDVKADPNTRNEVIYLKHASSKEVAPLLTNVVSGQNRALQTESSRGAAGAPAAVPAAAPAATGAGSSGAQEFSSFVTIQFDERSNALILSGTVDDIRMLRELINKIDVVLPQVLVEVIIAEVTLTDKDSTGLKELGLTVGTNATGARGIGAFSGAVGGWKVDAGKVDPLAFSAAMSNVGSRSNVKILSQPTIMTMHNKEGQVTVGSKQPVITGTTSTPISTGVTGNSNFATQQQVTYTDIAIDLKVTPLIGDDGTIQLKIDQKVDDVIDSIEVNGNSQPIIGHRQATSFVNVKDGEMVVLGGLQRVKNDRLRTKLGLLYEIPVLSQLLGSRTKNEERTELLLFVRPRVVPLEGGTENTKFKIDQLSNKDNIRRFLDDPKAPMKDTLSEKIK